MASFLFKLLPKRQRKCIVFVQRSGITESFRTLSQVNLSSCALLVGVARDRETYFTTILLLTQLCC